MTGTAASRPGLLGRPLEALRAWPTPSAWAEAIAISVGAALLISLAALPFLRWSPEFRPEYLIGFVVPAFTEELVFRGFVPTGGGQVGAWIVGTTALFVLWHAVETLTFLPQATLFLTPAFLYAAAILGLAAAVVRYRTGSLWPAVLLHGLVVVAWLSLFGGAAAITQFQPNGVHA